MDRSPEVELDRLDLILAKELFVPEGKTAIPCFHAKPPWRGSCVTFCD